MVKKINIERVQTGVRIEKKLLKVLKGLAEHGDLSLGELLEMIACHALERKHAFTQDSLPVIKKLKDVYKMKYDVHDHQTFIEK